MSDYLWDRTGERDAEVERLESLLGAFAHRARPLELPAEESSPAAPRAPWLNGFAGRLLARRLFAPAGLAAAAALALVIFGAAAWLLRARPGSDGGRPAARSHEAAQSGVAPKSSEPARRESVARDAKVERRAVVDEKRAVESLARGPLRRKGSRVVAAAPGREKVARVVRDGGGGASEEVFTFEAMRSGGGASALVENTRLLTKERLVYALRLTGAKLRDVRHKAQGLDAAEPRPR